MSEKIINEMNEEVSAIRAFCRLALLRSFPFRLQKHKEQKPPPHLSPKDPARTIIGGHVPSLLLR